MRPGQFASRSKLFASTALLAWAIAIPSASAQSQHPELAPHLFTYSHIELDHSVGSEMDRVRADVMSVLTAAGAAVYAVWTPADSPKGAPFEGLTPKQEVVMAVWPDRVGERAILELVDTRLKAVARGATLRTDLLESIFLASGAAVPTDGGFYVHREELYRSSDANEAVRLSREAWTTWEPFWGTRVVGLFRKRAVSPEPVRLLRIAWYRDFPHWLATRQAGKDPESARRFAARSKLEVAGSGRATATDRLIK